MLALLFLVAAFSPPLVSADATAVAEIDALLTSWHRAAAGADAAVYFGAMAPGAVFVGTDAGERWTKEEFEKWAEPFFRRGSAWVFTARSRHIELSPDGQTAWFDELLDSLSYWPCRGSGVVRKIDDRWRIVHYVLSFTIPNSVTGRIKPIVLRGFSGAAP